VWCYYCSKDYKLSYKLRYKLSYCGGGLVDRGGFGAELQAPLQAQLQAVTV